MFESTSTKHDTSVSDPLLADVEVQELEERDPPTYQQPSTEAMPSVRADGPGSSSIATQEHHATTMVYGLNLEWPIVPETIERQVVGVVFGSYEVGIPILSLSSKQLSLLLTLLPCSGPSQDTLQAIKRFFPELRSISNDRILVSVPLDRSTTLPLVGPLPSAGMSRPTLIGVTEEAWPGVVASKPVSVRIDVSYTPEEVKERQCPLFALTFGRCVAMSKTPKTYPCTARVRLLRAKLEDIRLLRRRNVYNWGSYCACLILAWKLDLFSPPPGADSLQRQLIGQRAAPSKESNESRRVGLTDGGLDNSEPGLARH